MTWSTAELEPDMGFGCVVRALSCDHLDDARVRAALRRLWTLHGLILFRDVPSTPQFMIKLGSCFGLLERHEVASMAVDGHPELIWLTTNGDQPVFEVEGEPVVGWFPWHSDTIWRTEVVRGGLLGARRLPERGGDTGFMCRILAYQSLPASLRRRIEGLEVVYKLSENIADHPYIRAGAVVRIVNPPANAEVGRLMAAMAPAVAHPLVATQAETGRKYLNFSPMGARHIVGLGDEAAHDLLMEIASHVCDRTHAYRHRWEAGDLVLWDNWRLNHRAYGALFGQARAMQRATIMGDGPQGRVLGK